jgi:hypothetical protein
MKNCGRGGPMMESNMDGIGMSMGGNMMGGGKMREPDVDVWLMVGIGVEPDYERGRAAKSDSVVPPRGAAWGHSKG